MLTSKLTSKSQATIPREVRNRLGLKPGDRIVFEMADKGVRLRRLDPEETAFLGLSAAAFADWLSPEDEEAFRDL